MTRVVLLGAPGAGKGTQGQLLSDSLDLPYIGAGDLMRAEIGAATRRAERLRDDVAAGRLIPDDVALEIISEALLAESEGFILDGFPRTVDQARSLDGLLASRLVEIDAVVRFRIDEQEIVSRLLARGRADDDPHIVRGRVEVYLTHEETIVDHYRGRIVELDAVGPVDSVFERLLSGLGEGGFLVLPRALTVGTIESSVRRRDVSYRW